MIKLKDILFEWTPVNGNFTTTIDLGLIGKTAKLTHSNVTGKNPGEFKIIKFGPKPATMMLWAPEPDELRQPLPGLQRVDIPIQLLGDHTRTYPAPINTFLEWDARDYNRDPAGWGGITFEFHDASYDNDVLRDHIMQKLKAWFVANPYQPKSAPKPNPMNVKTDFK